VSVIGCPLSGDVESWHTARSIPATTARLDLDYLQALVNESVEGDNGLCTYISHPTARAKRCGRYMLTLYNAYTDMLQGNTIHKVKERLYRLSVTLLLIFIYHCTWAVSLTLY
jgi:hypothetical protein